MSVWDDVVGQAEQVQVLQHAAHTGAPAHAWLFTGPPGSGRSTAARAFAAALQCPDHGCGGCHACRTALGGSHADVHVVTTEKLSIGVDDTRALVQGAQRRPAGGRWRVVLVEDADRMTEQAANALLKAVEEPPERTVWLLCAPSAEDVIPTIRSRCRQLRLRVPPVSDVAELLVRRDGVDPAMAAFAARAAQSHVGLARRLARDDGARIRRREVLRMGLDVRGVADALARAADLVEVADEESRSATAERDAAERSALLHSLGAQGSATVPPHVRAQLRQLEESQKKRATRSRRDVIDRALLDLLSLYRDVLLTQLGADVELVNAELRQDVERLAAAATPEATLRRMDAVGEARLRVQASVAPLLAVEAMALRLLDPVPTT